MKTRHVVTLVVALLAAGLLGGVIWRLQATASGEDGDGELSASADSVRREISSSAPSRAFATEVAVPVEGARVRRDTFVLWVRAEGEAAPLRRSVFEAEVAGPVTEVPVERGDRVSEGDLLVRIDPSEYRLDVREREAELERARADYESLILYDEQLEDDSLRAERRRQARIRSGVPQAEVALEKARSTLEQTEIRAPFDGWVADLAVEPGSRVREGDSLVSVLDLSRMEVEVQVLETALPAIDPGRRVRARFPAFPRREFEGRVAAINPRVDPESNTARVTVRLENPRVRIVPGMHASVEIAGRLHENRTFVPREAVVERDQRQVVFVFEPDEPGGQVGRAQWRYVNTGLESDEFVEIAPPEEDGQAGPEELRGRVVLVDGHSTLTHDARVRLENGDGLVEGSQP